MEAISQRVLDMKHVNGVKQVNPLTIFPCVYLINIEELIRHTKFDLKIFYPIPMT